MNRNQKILVQSSKEKTLDSLNLLKASLTSISPFDPSRKYTPKEREPFDALSDRFIRSVEISIKFFRSYELLLEGTNSETLRDLLNKMEKLKLISQTEMWIQMRDIRNRIVHDYASESIQEIYKLIMGQFGKELLNLKTKLETIEI